MEILEQFGIEWKLLIVQLINFAIFFFVFYKFILPKLKQFMDARSQRIKDALTEADQARVQSQQAEQDRQETLASALKEADQLVVEARTQADEQAERIIHEARAEAGRVIADGKAQLEADRTALRTELRAELGALTVATTRKVLEGMVTKADHDRMVKVAERKIGANSRRKAVRGR